MRALLLDAGARAERLEAVADPLGGLALALGGGGTVEPLEGLDDLAQVGSGSGGIRSRTLGDG